MKNLFFISCILFSFVLFPSCQNGGKSNAQKADSTNASNEPMAKDASDFMVEASMINLTEINLGKIAKTQAASSRVKSYASMIVSDHKKLQDKLQKLAQKEHVAIPNSLSKSNRSEISELKKKNEHATNKLFIKDMIAGHEKAIKTFKKAAENKDIRNEALKDYINNALPGLKTHQDSAQTIKKDLNMDMSQLKKSTPTMPIPQP